MGTNNSCAKCYDHPLSRASTKSDNRSTDDSGGTSKPQIFCEVAYLREVKAASAGIAGFSAL